MEAFEPGDTYNFEGADSSYDYCSTGDEPDDLALTNDESVDCATGDDPDCELEPYYNDPVKPPPSDDYYGAQGYRTLYDSLGRPPSGNYYGKPSSPEPKNSVFPPDSLADQNKPHVFSKKPSPQTMRAVVVAAVSVLGIGSGVVANATHHETSRSSTGQPAAEPTAHTGPFSDRQIHRHNNPSDVIDVAITINREYFGKKGWLSDADTDDCLVDTPYGGGVGGGPGKIDVDVTGHRPFYSARSIKDKQITVTVHPPKEHEGVPNLVFKRIDAFPYDRFGPADSYTQQVVDEQDCDTGK